MKSSQIKAGVILSYLQLGLNAVISLAYTPVMIRLLGQSEYGAYTVASSTIAYLGLLNFGLSSSYIRFYTRYKKQEDELGIARLNGIFLAVYTLIALVAFAAGTAMALNVELFFGSSMSAQELETVRILMLILSVNLFFTFLSTVFTAYIGANEEFVFQKAVNMGKTVLSPLLTLPLLFLGARSVAVALMTTVVGLAVDGANVFFCLKKLKMRFTLRGAEPRIIGEVAGFSVFIALNSIVDQINWQVDKFILGHYHGTAVTAVYGVASQVNNLYTSVSTAISSVFAPRVHKIAQLEDREQKFNALFTKIGRIQLLVLGLPASGMVLFGRDFIDLWAGEGYADAYYIMLLLALPATVPLIQNVGIEIQRALNMHQFRSILYVAMALLNLAISIPLGKYYGGIGCAAGTAFSLLLSNGLVINIYYSRKMHIDIGHFWKEMVPIFLAIGAASLVGMALDLLVGGSGLLSFGIKVVLYSGCYCGICWALAMNGDEKQMVKKSVRKLVRRKS